MNTMNLVVEAAIVVGVRGVAHFGLLALGSWFDSDPRPPSQSEIGSLPRLRSPRSRCRASRSFSVATTSVCRSGFPVTGMAIRRDVALAHRFHAPASEDLFFALDLLLGVPSVLVAGGLAVVAGAWTLTAVFGSAFALLVRALLTGLSQARAGLSTWLALCVAPWYLVWKDTVQLRAVARDLRRDDSYGPTARA